MKPRWFNQWFCAMDALWYRKHVLRWCLYPLALLYTVVVACRRHYLVTWRQRTAPIPVVVIGNISVGGVGKTPLVIALAHFFQARGLRVGIVSRGYGCRIRQFPHAVNADDTAETVGDEPWLLFKKTRATVVIAPRRMDAVDYLVQQTLSDIILSDDGLQHYAMGRAIEIAVIDGLRGLGNRLCLPAGPLREQPRRLTEVDFVVVNAGDWPDAYRMELVPVGLFSLATGLPIAVHELDMPVAAVAGIGNPERFFNTLVQLQVAYQPYRFPDHHRFVAADFQMQERVIMMTEKDAVKCGEFMTERMHYLSIEARLPANFWQALAEHPRLAQLFVK